MRIIFPTASVILRVHQEVLVREGCHPGVRSHDLIDSAAARPRNVYGFEPESSILRLAAVLAFGIAKNHPFVDGNKRVSWLASMHFAEINGYAVTASEDESYNVFIALARGEVSEMDLVGWFEERGAPTL